MALQQARSTRRMASVIECHVIPADPQGCGVVAFSMMPQACKACRSSLRPPEIEGAGSVLYVLRTCRSDEKAEELY